jgi:hypothetical protein
MTLRRLIAQQLEVASKQSAEDLIVMHPRVTLAYAKNMLLLMKAAKQVYVEAYRPQPNGRGKHSPLYSKYFDGCVPAIMPVAARKHRRLGPPDPKHLPAPEPARPVRAIIGGIPWLPGL